MKTNLVYLLTIIVAVTCSTFLQAQNDVATLNRRKVSYDAFVSGKMENWVPVIQEIERIETPTHEEKIELIRYYYGYTAYLIGMKDKKNARVYVKKGDRLIKNMLADKPDNATALAFKGSFTGFKVVLNKFKIITLGPESIRCINRAYKADPNDLQAITDKANLLYFTPGLFGGNKKESFEFFERAIAKIEAENDTNQSWFYLALLTLLAEHYEKEGHTDKATATQKKIKSIEPNLQWIKEKILSKLDEEET